MLFFLANYNKHTSYMDKNRIGGVIINVFASNAVDREFDPGSGQTKDYKLIVVASLLSMQH